MNDESRGSLTGIDLRCECFFYSYGFVVKIKHELDLSLETRVVIFNFIQINPCTRSNN